MGKSVILSILFFNLFFSPFLMNGQEFIGFWEIDEVRVGGEIMTPVAKWTRINKDGTYTTGNGWSQTSSGKWDFDQNSKSLTVKETKGMQIQDENEPFKVSFESNQMSWQREESETSVVVTFKRINKLPMATADKLTGIWSLKEILLDNIDINSQLNPEGKNYLFIKPDKTFTERKSEGNLNRDFGTSTHINPILLLSSQET